MSRFKDAFFEQTQKVFTAFITWGLGILFMVGYCLFIYWLNRWFGSYVMIAGGLVYLGVFYFFVDLWWGYKRGRLLEDR